MLIKLLCRNYMSLFRYHHLMPKLGYATFIDISDTPMLTAEIEFGICQKVCGESVLNATYEIEFSGFVRSQPKNLRERKIRLWA